MSEFVILLQLLVVLDLPYGWASLSLEDNVLHIGGIFPIEGEGGWQGGQVTLYL